MKSGLILVLILMTSFSAFATSGCLYTSSGYIYIVPGGTGGPGVPNFTYSGQASQRISASSYCVVTLGNTTSCYINYSSGSAYGTLVDYSAAPCAVPIDSKLYILMIGTIGLSSYFLRKRLILA